MRVQMGLSRQDIRWFFFILRWWVTEMETKEREVCEAHANKTHLCGSTM
jgi:hypothetical protein